MTQSSGRDPPRNTQARHFVSKEMIFVPYRWDNRQVWVSENGLDFTARPPGSGALLGWATDSTQFLVTDSRRR